MRPLALLQRLGGLPWRLVICCLSRMANSGQGGEGSRLGEVVEVEEKKVEIIDEEEDEEEGLPDAATARKLIKEFETVTNTDEIMAQYQLQVICFMRCQLISSIILSIPI